jgi:preprotein translocase subunit SecG
MGQNERPPCCRTASTRDFRERLTVVLVLLFIIVLLVMVLFPQAVPSEVLVIIARLLDLVIASYVRRGDTEL